MTHSEDAVENKSRCLVEAIDQLGGDVWKVEIWAGALLGLASSVPVYEPGNWLHCLAATRATASAEQERKAA
jgi:hypothetical protein